MVEVKENCVLIYLNDLSDSAKIEVMRALGIKANDLHPNKVGRNPFLTFTSVTMWRALYGKKVEVE